ncbi:hypothetical protein Tmel_0945 [Thermosipho melanesiensis BI429]|uniref:Uncharacterized protein n=2 Tax=Thermosipho melanesiensis TaxID=46541 RepID=A6LLK5_THEM4|nr:hypothetical protein Tmel_0945 [Thermosipho melanesiensis BI429]
MLFDNTIILNAPPFFMELGDGVSIGLSYSTSTTYYKENNLGFLKVTLPQNREYVSASLFLGTNFGVYVSIGNENLQIPTSFKSMEFFISKDYAFYTSLSKFFIAIGPLTLNTRSIFLKKGKDFGYSLNRTFVKYKEYSGYFLSLNGIYFLGYFYPLDNSLEQGILGGLGSNFNEIYLNIGIRKHFNFEKLKCFGYGYIYSSTNNVFGINYFAGIYITFPLKGEITIWDGKISFRFNW